MAYIYIQKTINGQAVGVCAAEILAVPYYELIDAELEKANNRVQVVFKQLINSFSVQMEKEKVAFEFLWHSTPVQDQSYAAQVKMHVVFRMLGSISDIHFIKKRLEGYMLYFQNEVVGLNYDIDIFDTPEQYSIFLESMDLGAVSNVYAITKKERIISIPYYGHVYYNDEIIPSNNQNSSIITNALSNNPKCIVAFQLIPTSFTDLEIMMIGITKNDVSQLATNLRWNNGPHLDAAVNHALYYYEQLDAVSREPCFYYNFLVYSQNTNGLSLGSKIINQLETDNKEAGYSFEIINVTGKTPDMKKAFSVSPWAISNALVYNLREEVFWKAEDAPKHMMRIRYLLSSKEIAPIFKLPIDDGNTIGLDSQRTQRTIEKLNDTIMAEGSFKLGTIRSLMKAQNSGNSDAGIPINDFTKHGLIVGMPGSGKTNFSLGILLQFWKKYKIPFLVIEPTKTEYRSLVDAIPELQVFTPGKGDVSNYIINPFLPPPNVTVETYAPGLMTAFKAAFNMPSPLPNVFMNAINSVYVKYGWKKRSTLNDSEAEKFGMYEFIRVFKQVASNLGYQGETKSNIESAGVLRLISLIEQNSNTYDTINTIPLTDLLGKPTVIELNAIADKEQKSLIMAFLLIMICSYTKNNMIGDGLLKNIILIDEAHVLLDNTDIEPGGTKATTIATIEDMIAEVRSLGTGIIIADQSPTKIGKYIIANTNVKVVFKLVEKESRDVIGVTTNMSAGEYDELSRLGVGQAMLHFGRLNSPLQISTYNIDDIVSIRKTVRDEEIHNLSDYWHTPEHEKLLIPYRECRYCDDCEKNCDQKTRDDAEYISSKILQDYPDKTKDKKEFVRFLVTMNSNILNIINTRPSMQSSKRLINCVKVKYFRKALLEAAFEISEEERSTILRHDRFMLRNNGFTEKESCIKQ